MTDSVDNGMTSTTAETTAVTEMAAMLDVTSTRYGYIVTVTARGWIDIRNDPARQIDPTAKLDFLRLVNDDNTWRLIHLTHNEIIKGEATFSNSLVGALYGVVTDFFESL